MKPEQLVEINAEGIGMLRAHIDQVEEYGKLVAYAVISIHDNDDNTWRTGTCWNLAVEEAKRPMLEAISGLVDDVLNRKETTQ